MAARAIGALFAVVAALLFVAALAGALAPSVVPGWRDGHPRVAGHNYDRKEVHVGLLSATGCNLGPPVECESVSTGSLLEPVGIAELAALALVTLTTIGLLVSIWRIGERRRGLGRLVIIEALIAAAIAGTWIAIGIEIKGIDAEVDVPLGLGLFAFAGGAAAAVVAGVLARFVEREPLRLKSPRVAPAAQPPQRDPFEAFDVRELVPTGTGPQAPVQPQLRALYDVVTPPVPPAPLPMPIAAPVFVDADDLGDVAGAHIPTPSTPQHALPISRPTPPPPRLTPPPQPPLSREVRRELGEAPTIPASAGMRAASSTQPPPPPIGALEPPTVPAPSAKSQRAKAASLPPPAALRMRPGASGSHPAHPGLGAGAVPERAARQPTTPHVAPPAPTAAARAATEADPATTVEIDAEAKAKWKAQQAKSAAAAAQAAQVEADAQELAIASAPTRAAEPLDFAELADSADGTRPPADTAENALALLAAEYSTGDSTDVQRVIEPTPAHPTPLPMPTIIGPVPIPEPLAPLASAPPAAQPSAPPGAPTAQMAAVTVPPPARSPIMKAPQISVPKIIPAMPSAAAPKPDGEHRDREHNREREPKDVKVPLSTAPASLPPPKPAQATTSGPTPACPQCEAPMAWVEEHLRFYCAQCRMYF